MFAQAPIPFVLLTTIRTRFDIKYLPLVLVFVGLFWVAWKLAALFRAWAIGGTAALVLRWRHSNTLLRALSYLLDVLIALGANLAPGLVAGWLFVAASFGYGWGIFAFSLMYLHQLSYTVVERQKASKEAAGGVPPVLVGKAHPHQELTSEDNAWTLAGTLEPAATNQAADTPDSEHTPGNRAS
ncbi:MAG TPA: hypothetical protein VH540_19895 [Ktedonobacterales bacterium]|jgi:hypothetical protein